MATLTMARNGKWFDGHLSLGAGRNDGDDQLGGGAASMSSMFDDFLYIPSSETTSNFKNWLSLWVSSGAGSVGVSAPVTNYVNGIWELAATNGNEEIGTFNAVGAQTKGLVPYKPGFFAARIAVKQMVGATGYARVGGTNTRPSYGTNATMANYFATNRTNSRWDAVSVNTTNGSTTTTDTGVAYDTNYHIFTITYPLASYTPNQKAIFLIDDVVVATHTGTDPTTNLPRDALLVPWVQVYSPAAAQITQVYIDWIMLHSQA